MQQAEAKRLRNLLSQSRLAEYELRCAGDPVAALRLHCWNTEISEAFYGPLQYLEVSMRSVMTKELVSLFGQRDWWASPQADLHYGARRKITEATDQLRRSGLPADPQQITDELPFGFYVSLLGPGNNYDQRLWRPALYRAFPGYHGRRRDLHRRFDYLRVFAATRSAGSGRPCSRAPSRPVRRSSMDRRRHAAQGTYALGHAEHLAGVEAGASAGHASSYPIGAHTSALAAACPRCSGRL
jgi:hypothetical protein